MAYFRKYYTSKGEVRYKAEIKIKGAKPYSKSFRALSHAKLWARDQEHQSEKIIAGIKTHKQYTLSECVERYLEERMPERTYHRVKYLLTWWVEHLGDRFMDTLRSEELLRLRNLLMKEPAFYSHSKPGKPAPKRNPDGSIRVRAPQTVQHYMDQLGVLYNVAINEWEWASSNPVQKIKKLEVNNERDRFLSDHFHLWPGEEEAWHWDELNKKEQQQARMKFPRAYELPRLIDALLDQVNKPQIKDNKPLWAYYLFVIQLGTGLRVSEANNLVWEENNLIEHPIVIVDMNRAVLHLKSTKNDKSPRLKPISKEAFEVLKILYEERRYDSPLVFHNTDGTKPFDFKRRIYHAIRDAGLQDFRWHDLRHTTASYLSMMGAGQKEIMDALHHKSMKSSERYQHLSNEHLRGLLNKLSFTVLTEKEAPSRFEKVSVT
ncbi:site-specific integrase [Kordiimonas sp. SCSIO 12603]|uniref:tyrosine-type recombinase/integrase n=1 Tax=Kordiimonas sp. SCSIO 12603 TaxID=2829596 RepID=UPI002101DA37|nr:site-specific integrase [Kordiimonas sp. SCSIO 12603]UTW58846.1 site-specific integrase [Kordiimonas sp. SCSIO 12603]